MSFPCCPPNSVKYLAPSYNTEGTISQLDDGTDFYYAAPKQTSNKGILIFADAYGWNSGRTRNIADQFAEAGYHTVIPKLLGPGLDGGTDGDGVGPDFSFETSISKFLEYVAERPWSSIAPHVASAIAYFKTLGVTRIGTVGFCWGGWAVIQALADFPDDIQAGASPHPSVHLEDYLGRSAVALCENAKRPMLFLPAANDPDTYDEGGKYFEAVRKNNPESETYRFTTVPHGFVSRGDIEDPVVKEAIDGALNRIYSFFSRLL